MSNLRTNVIGAVKVSRISIFETKLPLGANSIKTLNCLCQAYKHAVTRMLPVQAEKPRCLKSTMALITL